MLWESDVSEQICLLPPIGSVYPGNELRELRAHPAPLVGPLRCSSSLKNNDKYIKKLFVVVVVATFIIAFTSKSDDIS